MILANAIFYGEKNVFIILCTPLVFKPFFLYVLSYNTGIFFL